jgi:OmcA/MtrC family decaheme c-type cytochrome
VTVGTGHTQRFYLRISNPSSTTYTKGAAATVDFKVPATGAAATPLTSQRVIVTIQACWKCHSTTLLAAGHGGGYADTKGCVVCHSPLYASGTNPAGFMANFSGDPDTEPYHNYTFPDWIHHIHAAKLGFEEVTYPQDIKKCDVCHTGTGDQIDNWKNHPTRLACGSCHTTADFATGATFTGLDGVSKTHAVQTSDVACTACHPNAGPISSGVRPVPAVHDTVPAAGSANDPEFDVTLAMSAPTATSAFYSAGDVVTITATLNVHGGAAVPGTTYTTAKQAAGTTGGGLSTASLYIYGPRSLPLPLTGTQANSLFTGGTNTNVKTDASGFKYQLTIPAGLTPGTYMLRFRAGDYGRVNDTNYRIESTAFNTFQIGTATVEKKIDGDMCVNCHGDGTLPAHDARHAVVVNSDECVACHDFSGGHADPLANRVHAIHAASAHGDLLDAVSSPMDWSEVTYPQGSMGQSSAGISTGAKICVGCHTSGSTDYKSHAVGSACYGCHGDSQIVVDHMVQNGGPVK